jgi:hypothetical protein
VSLLEMVAADRLSWLNIYGCGPFGIRGVSVQGLMIRGHKCARLEPSVIPYARAGSRAAITAITAATIPNAA